MDNINNNSDFGPCNIWNDATYGNTLKGGEANELLYQVKKNVTGFLPNGTDNQILTSKTLSKPEWKDGEDITVGHADNLSGGLTGNIMYQTAPGATVFLENSNAGKVLITNGPNNPPSWSSHVKNLSDGSIGNIPFQASVNVTAFIPNGTAGQVLTSNGDHQPYYGDNIANIRGGVSGNLMYQSATDTTSFLTNGTAGQVLTSNGANPPTWETVVSGETLENVLIAGNNANGQSINGFSQLTSSVISVYPVNFTITDYYLHTTIVSTGMGATETFFSSFTSNDGKGGDGIQFYFTNWQLKLSEGTDSGTITVTKCRLHLRDDTGTTTYDSYTIDIVEGNTYVFSATGAIALPIMLQKNILNIPSAQGNDDLKVYFEWEYTLDVLWSTHPSNIAEIDMISSANVIKKTAHQYEAPKKSILEYGNAPDVANVYMIYNNRKIEFPFSCPDLRNLYSQSKISGEAIGNAQEGTPVGTFECPNLDNNDNFWIVPSNFGLICYNDYDYTGTILLNYKNTENFPNCVRPSPANATSSVRIFYLDVEQVIVDRRT